MILNYNEFGEGKTIVILHGLLGSLGNWVSLAKVLSERFHVILVDLPNHGQSHHTDHFSYESMAKEVSFLLKHNELCNINLIGHSMGGKVAMKYAELFSDNTSKLVIVDIANRNYKSNKFTHIFDGISSLNLSDIKSRVDADKLIKSFVPNLGERNFLLKNLKREEGTFKWSPNIHLLKSSLDKISSKINIKNNLEVNAGHDLDLKNLNFLKKSIPNLYEVSIGHALICDSLYYGLEKTIKLYLSSLK